MPVIYQTYQSQFANRSGKKLYYPRVVLTGSVGTDQIAREISELSSLTTGDVKNVIDNLVTVVTRHLQASESADVSATQSQLKVRFLPTGTRHADGTLATRSLVQGAKCVRFEAVPADPDATQPGGEDEEDSGQGTFG